MAATHRFFDRKTDPYLTTRNVTHTRVDEKFLNPVGQIVELGEKGEIVNRFCSGFNVNRGQYFLTAGHCISSAFGEPVCFSDDSRSPIPNGRCAVSFGYEAPEMRLYDGRMVNLSVPEYVFRITETVSHGYCKPAQTDYGVLKLAPGAEKWGSLEFANYSPSIGHPIVIIHHPKGIPKRLSEGKITSYTLKHSCFIYNAATHGGSSGAPVLSNVDGKVLGVHVAGNEATQQTNTAVSMSTILTSTKKSHYEFFGYSSPSISSLNVDGDSVELHRSPTQPGGGCCQ
jgi:V8-like Glu-specific endopeptidase